MKGRWSVAGPILGGVVLALIALVLLFPIDCSGTDIGIPANVPYPNDASCGSILFTDSSEMEGGHPDTSADRTTYDVVFGKVIGRALIAAAVPLAVGLVVGLANASRRRAPRSPARSSSREGGI